MAKKYVKWVGGIVGWAFAGPIGGLIGYGLGYLWDNASLEGSFDGQSSSTGTREGDFNIALLVLSAAVMKADDKVLKSELSYVKSFLVQNFGESKSLELLRILKDVLEKDIDVRGVCAQIRNHMSHAQRLQLVHFLIGIARADGNVHPSEANILEKISRYLYVSVQDFGSMNTMYKDVLTKDDYLKVLELDSDATPEQIKKAYRKMAKKYHPDKLGDVGEDVKEASLEKFRKVQEAYDALTKK